MVSNIFLACSFTILRLLPAELRVMFAQDGAHGTYMDRFFAEHPYPSVSWIHDMAKRRHGAAASTLLSEAQGVSDLATKHVGLR